MPAATPRASGPGTRDPSPAPPFRWSVTLPYTSPGHDNRWSNGSWRIGGKITGGGAAGGGSTGAGAAADPAAATDSAVPAPGPAVPVAAVVAKRAATAGSTAPAR